MERNIRLLIEYDGSRYDGWQRLGKGHGVTIQGKLEDVLSKMTGEQVELIGAGRTDAGVHAYEQVANFHTNSNMKCWEMKYYLNRYLPGDIAVNRVDDVPERFHSRYNAKAKKYLYRIAIGDVPCVFDRKYTWYCFDKLDVTAMKRRQPFLLENMISKLSVPTSVQTNPLFVRFMILIFMLIRENCRLQFMAMVSYIIW